MRLLLVFARRYPWQSLLVLGCLLLAAVAEGIGLSSLLPLLSLATDSGTSTVNNISMGSSQVSRIITRVFAMLGVQPSIGALLLLIVISLFTKAGLVLLAQKQVGYAVAQVATDLRLTLIRSILAARWGYYIHQPVGGFANAFATEANRASQAYLHGVTILALILETTLCLGVAALASWRVALSATAAGVLIMLSLGRLVRITRRAGRRQTEILKTVLSRLTDVLYAVKPLKAMAREALVGNLLEKETQQLNRSLRREISSKEAVKALQEPLVIAALAVGLYVAMTDWALPLNTLILMAILFGRALSSLTKIQKPYQQMVACDSALWSLQDMVERATAAREVIPNGHAPRLAHAIDVKQVTLTYGDRVILANISLRIPVGEVTAIIGPSGAGKTSIADVIVGLIQPQTGEVYLDEVPLSNLDLRAWRQMVGYMPQEALLLHESVLTNITLGDQTLTVVDVEAALRAAGAWEFVASLPEGLATAVGERGARFSGGQRQRIAIARALVHRPQLLILDEATAALDRDSEAAICETVRRLRGTTTILVISHQPALLEVADHVYRLDAGTLSPVGLTPFIVAAQAAG